MPSIPERFRSVKNSLVTLNFFMNYYQFINANCFNSKLTNKNKISNSILLYFVFLH